MSEPDWVDDQSVSSEEILARFRALGPEASRGPHHLAMTYSAGTTITYIDGVRQD
jgi:hypothetical protein